MPQTLEAQNMELAERLAQLSQFVTYKAQSTKNASVDFGERSGHCIDTLSGVLTPCWVYS